MKGQRIMELGRFRNVEQSSSVEGTSSQRKDEIRRRAASQSHEASFSKGSEVTFQGKQQKRLEKYEEEAKKYQKKDKDHNEDGFNKEFTTNCSLKKGIFHIISENEFGRYEIDLDNGQIIGYRNESKNTQTWHLSDIIYNQLLFILKKAEKNISQFDLKSWYGFDIANKNTKNVAKKILGYENRKTFKSNSKEFKDIAITDAAQSKFYLLAQYPKAFKGKKVTSITVKRYADGQIDIEYEFS
jgi:hypothetical protein